MEEYIKNYPELSYEEIVLFLFFVVAFTFIAVFLIVLSFYKSYYNSKAEKAIVYLIVHFFITNYDVEDKKPSFFISSVRKFFPIFSIQFIRTVVYNLGGNINQYTYKLSCNTIKKHSDKRYKLLLIRLFFEFAFSDDKFDGNEKEFIKKTHVLIGLDPSIYFAFKNKYDKKLEEKKKKEEQERKKQEAFFNYIKQQKKKKSVSAYKVLGINTSANKSEIKTAYRKLAKKFHPDRHPKAGSEQLVVLQEKFYKISEAYDTLISLSGKNQK